MEKRGFLTDFMFTIGDRGVSKNSLLVGRPEPRGDGNIDIKFAYPKDFIRVS